MSSNTSILQKGERRKPLSHEDPHLASLDCLVVALAAAAPCGDTRDDHAADPGGTDQTLAPTTSGNVSRHGTSRTWCRKPTWAAKPLHIPPLLYPKSNLIEQFYDAQQSLLRWRTWRISNSFPLYSPGIENQRSSITPLISNT